MSEFILVKNDDNSGHLLLRVASIRGAEDDFTDDGKPDGSIIWYENEENCYSASTASEVLAAIQEAQGVVPRQVEGTLAVDTGKGQDASRLAFYSADGRTLDEIVALPSPTRLSGITWHHVAPPRTSPVDGSQLSSSAFTEARITETQAQVGSCTCPLHQGGNPACPVHGVGTAWGDLHGD